MYYKSACTQLGKVIFASELIGLLKEFEGKVDRLITIVSIPKKDFSFHQVWGALKLSHSSLRGSKTTNYCLVYYGAKLGDAEDLGVRVTVKDEVKDIVVNGRLVYVSRYFI